MTENYVETLGKKLLMDINPVNRVLTKNNSFDPKWPETHFSPWSTWFDPYWPGGLGFDPKRLETHFLPWSTWFDPYWLGGLGFDRKWRFWPKMMVLTENSFFTLVAMVWPVLTWWNQFLWKDVVDSRKIYFWILNFFLIFLDFYK